LIARKRRALRQPVHFNNLDKSAFIYLFIFLVYLFVDLILSLFFFYCTRYIAVGDEPFLLRYGQKFQPYVIGAVTNIHLALKAAKLTDRIKLIVPCNSDVYQTNSSLPSKAHFRSDLNNTMVDLLTFLSNNSSPFVLDMNPFSSFQQNKNLSLNFHLFQLTSRPLTDGHNKYDNYFDLSIDSVVSSLSKVGFGDMEIMVGSVGWPTDGALNATSANAQIFMQGLINHLKAKTGSPLRPKRPPTETYLFTLLDEDQLYIAAGNYERHYGIFTFDGQAKYNVDLGQGSRPLKNVHEVNYLNQKWCVVNNNKDLSNITANVAQACSNADCSSLSPGGSCAGIGWPGNASYAFNNYFQANGQSQESCDFNGLGLITTVDPSVGECRFMIGLHTSDSSSVFQSVVVLRQVISVFVFGIFIFWI
jgi:Glycosyl hydrolases family 17/X8 domain